MAEDRHDVLIDLFEERLRAIEGAPLAQDAAFEARVLAFTVILAQPR